MPRKVTKFGSFAGAVPVSRFPFAVRKRRPRHNGKYRLRGDCCMHGLMGEHLFEKARADVQAIMLI
jgi:hypothetical protein